MRTEIYVRFQAVKHHNFALASKIYDMDFSQIIAIPQRWADQKIYKKLNSITHIERISGFISSPVESPMKKRAR